MLGAELSACGELLGWGCCPLLSLGAQMIELQQLHRVVLLALLQDNGPGAGQSPWGRARLLQGLRLALLLL